MIIIKTTSDSHKAMKDITNALLNKRYAACVNIIPRMRSKYVLDGRIVESREVMLLIKTSQDLEAKVYQTIKEMHNYDIPEISTIPTSNVDKDYLKWINESLELGKK
ncbi:MAG: divalent-cation tolerance protein CutA [Candidatus Marinimicrobia bacterium]|jgi:periplasmic divalent cation tolerance protein|nr:divalent-cation tolerance protein CutA [Gammaproteobacteria bacterium]MBL6911852.1 divalent-cation tolerance protein CutA [Candidatus Neomarinimicrobiota bacterium]MBT3728252.1 divalent-cation tolerance protein CutA [Candidatus Neomarinimicrobiota bacterium]MBT3944361.1 divalent-cation tolerance protein CutA [Candidatus Neomarinimicrobiota bacterium]MBT4112332.1 divalent-cation tolerance protein CutA [Candidatus Neomarinimicrobiota bacterium]